MTFYYLDSSAWVKRYYDETGTDWVQALFDNSKPLACSALGLVEVTATLARKHKAGAINSSTFGQKIEDLEKDWQNFIHVELRDEAMDIAANLAKQLALRGADAVHLGSCLLLQRRIPKDDHQVILITSDNEMKEAARISNLAVIDPNEEG
ncbi:PIN domain-containing protein [Candidatus Poribacteria bacterium]|nr:PIN domain-containing protein [Candidatus Poribacteria bacterium]